MADNSKPLARTQDLIVQASADETLVYDRKHHQAHCLNKTAGLVWRHCDGHRTPADLAEVLTRLLGAPCDVEMVDLALEELAQANLLEGQAPVAPEQRKFSRRLLLRAGAAAILVPAITSILTQRGVGVARAGGGGTTSGFTTSGYTTTPSYTTPYPTTPCPTTPAPTTRPPRHDLPIHDAVPHDAVPHDAVPHDAVPHDAGPHDSAPRHDLPIHDAGAHHDAASLCLKNPRLRGPTERADGTGRAGESPREARK